MLNKSFVHSGRNIIFSPIFFCRYKRIFSVGSHGITTYNPNTMEVTNQVNNTLRSIIRIYFFLKILQCQGQQGLKPLIAAAFIIRTFPSSGHSRRYIHVLLLPGRWIPFQNRTYMYSAQFPLPREHSLPSSYRVIGK